MSCTPVALKPRRCSASRPAISSFSRTSGFAMPNHMTGRLEFSSRHGFRRDGHSNADVTTMINCEASVWTTMKAMICRQWGGPEDLRLEEVDRPALKPGQVRIAVRAAGVSFATTLVIAGKYQRRPPFPFAPGTEVSGVVIEADAACRRLKAGDEGVAGLAWGGLAEETVAHEVNVFPKPKNVGFVEAIQLAISYPTSGGALTWPTVLDVQKGQTLLVHAAAGGVGMAPVGIGTV